LQPADATPEQFASLSQQVCKSYVQGINVARTRVQDHSGQPGESTAIRAFQILAGQAQTQMGRTRELHADDSATSATFSSWVDTKRPQQQPQFNYSHGLERDLCNAGVHIDNWASLASDSKIWHTITQQKNMYCNTNGVGYIWVDPEQLAQAAAENTLPSPHSLPSPLSYAGVLLGLLSLPDASTPVVPTIPSPASPTLQTPRCPNRP
jgi:hypothetical protein